MCIQNYKTETSYQFLDWVEMVGTNTPPTKTGDAPRVDLRILATSDLHMQVLSYNYITNSDHYGRGFAQTATLIRQAQKEVQNSILVDNGDLLTGTNVAPSVAMETASPHPMIRIMSALGYDAATPGNHDFDHGLSYLLRASLQADFPFLSANTFVNYGQKPTPTQKLFKEFVVLNRKVIDADGGHHDIRIAITGFLPPGSIAQFDSNEYQIHTQDIITAANRIIPQMKAAGADIILVLAHTGIGKNTHTNNMENAAVPLAAIDGIDAIISGHMHQVFPGPGWTNTASIDGTAGTVHGTPTVAPGYLGSHLGVIDLDLRRHNSSWVVHGHKSSLREALQSTQPDPIATEIFAPVHEKMLEWSAQPVGRNAKRITSFFALAAPSLASQTIQRAQTWYIKTHCSEYFDPDVPLLSSACSFKTGGYGGPTNFSNIPPLPITNRCLTELYPFHNHITLLQVNGTLLREWLERSASVFSTALPGNDHQTSLLQPDVPGYFFETVQGVDYAIDLSQTARYNQIGEIISPTAHRIQDLKYNDMPVTDDQEFTLITNNFRQGGGGFYPAPCLESPIHVPGQSVQSILASYFKTHQDQAPILDPHWRFTPIPGARFTFRSSPKALRNLPVPTSNDIQPLGQDDAGFQLFNLIL